MIRIEQRNSIIDGWRGVSVLLVIVGHLFGYRVNISHSAESLNFFGLPFGTKSMEVITSLGTLGVSFFFVISGFLITSLLVAEEAKRDSVSLKAFYARRIFRIMPAFYFYVATVYVLRTLGLVEAQGDAFLRSSLYVCNFSGFSCSWWLAHTWSLGVEEQFYLVWPVVFVLAGTQRTLAAAMLLAALVAGSLVVPELGKFSYILLGVLVALMPRLQERLSRIHPAIIWCALAILVFMPFLPGFVRRVIDPAQPVLAALVFFGVLFGVQNRVLRWLLQQPLLAKVGLVSYSLYLWQQLSLAPLQWGGGSTGAHVLYAHFGWLWSVAFIPIAIASYFWIERPLVGIGHALSRRILDSRRVQQDAVAAVDAP